jgi:hypothetical protein
MARLPSWVAADEFDDVGADDHRGACDRKWTNARW